MAKQSRQPTNLKRKVKGGNVDMDNKAYLLLGVIFCLSLASTFMVYQVGNREVEVPAPEISIQDKADIARQASELVIQNLPEAQPAVGPTFEIPAAELSDEDRAYLQDVSDLDEELLAEELALDELDSRDFKKELRSLLNDEGSNIESYKDITSFSVKDTDVDVHGDEAEVEFELRVYFFEDGDDDEDAIQSARVRVTLMIEDVDESEDAEVADYDWKQDFEFIKFYDN